MSFSDLMSSGRGPGVIGMVMALIVLLGFGLLFMFATDEGLQGGDQSIESLIAHQAKDIEFAKGTVENGRELMGDAPERIKKAKELSRLKRGSLALQERVVALERDIESGKAEAVLSNKAFEDYKDQYRAYVRGKAKGETLDTLETGSGVIYKNVSIREVTAVGIQIRHDDGHKRIAFEELPEAMKDHFQFDPKQKAAAVASEQAKWNEHEAAVSVANLAADRQVEARTAMEVQALREKIIRSIANKESLARSLSEEIKNLEKSIPREMEKRISNAPQMRAQLSNKRSNLAALRADIARMRAGLSN
jgi:hypothetical protein